MRATIIPALLSFFLLLACPAVASCDDGQSGESDADCGVPTERSEEREERAERDDRESAEEDCDGAFDP